MTWPFGDLQPGAYRTVILDPPWQFDVTQRLSGSGRRASSARAHYSTMTADEISALPVGDLIGNTGHCWLWCTSAILATGTHRGIVEAWGFRPITVVTWCKPGQPGLGKYLRNTTEHAVLAVRGWGTVPETAAASTWWQWGRGAHSVKPAGFGDLVEQVSPGPYVELFARQQRLGWDSWGLGHETEVVA